MTKWSRRRWQWRWWSEVEDDDDDNNNRANNDDDDNNGVKFGDDDENDGAKLATMMMMITTSRCHCRELRSIIVVIVADFAPLPSPPPTSLHHHCRPRLIADFTPLSPSLLHLCRHRLCSIVVIADFAPSSPTSLCHRRLVGRSISRIGVVYRMTDVCRRF